MEQTIVDETGRSIGLGDRLIVQRGLFSGVVARFVKILRDGDLVLQDDEGNFIESAQNTRYGG